MLSVAGLSFLCEDKGDFLYNCPGPLWFIPALFWSRIIYCIVENCTERHKLLTGVIVLISFSSVYVGSKYYLPMYIGHGGAGLIFFHIGRLFRNFLIGERLKKHTVRIAAIIAVCAGMCVGEVYFFNLSFSFWFLNVASASGATFMIYVLSKRICDIKFAGYFTFLGKISMLVLCVHATDGALLLTKNILDLLSLKGTFYYLTYNLMLISIAVIGVIALAHIKIVRRVFNIKK